MARLPSSLSVILSCSLLSLAQADALPELGDDALSAVTGQAGLTVTINNSAPVTATQWAIEDDGLRLRLQLLSWSSVTTSGAAAATSSPIVVSLDPGTDAASSSPALALDCTWARRRLKVEDIRIDTSLPGFGAFAFDSSGQFSARLSARVGDGSRLSSNLSLNDGRLFWRDEDQELVADQVSLSLNLPDTTWDLTPAGLTIAGTSGQLNFNVGKLWLQTDSTSSPSYSRASPGNSLGGFGLSGPLTAYSLGLSGAGQVGSQGLRADYSFTTADTFVDHWQSGGPDALWLTGQHSLSGSLWLDVVNGGATTSPWTWQGSSLSSLAPQTSVLLSLRNGQMSHVYNRVAIGTEASAGNSLGGLAVILPNLNADLFLVPGGASGTGLSFYPQITSENGALGWLDGGLGTGWLIDSLQISESSNTLDLENGQLTWRIAHGLLSTKSRFVTSDLITHTPLFGLNTVFYGSATLGLKAPTDGRPLLQMPIAFSLDNDIRNQIALLNAEGTGSLALKHWSGLAMASTDARIGVENGQFVFDLGQLVHQTDARVQEVNIGSSTLGQLFMPAQSSLHTAVKIWGH